MSNQDFIKKMATYAMEDMRNNKILASLTIAQAILESGLSTGNLLERMR